MTDEQASEYFASIIKTMIADRGEVIYTRVQPCGSWQIVLSTEHAALKVFHEYRHTAGLNFGESPIMGGWYVSVVK